MRHSLASISLLLGAMSSGCALEPGGGTSLDGAEGGSTASILEENIDSTEEALSANVNLPLFGLERYGVVAFGDVRELTHVDDTMAVRGNLSLGSASSADGFGIYLYGSQLQMAGLPIAEPSVVVGGNVYIGVGAVHGVIHYGGTANINGNSAQGVLVKHPSKSANFGVYEAAANRISSHFKAIAGAAPSVTTDGTGKTTYRFTGTQAVNVFSLDPTILNDVSDTRNIIFDVPPSSTTVVNVAGGTVTATRIDLSGANFGKVLWNFHDATALTINTIKLQGTVLAPAAALSFGNGRIEGSVIVKSIPGDGDKTGAIVHNPFIGNLGMVLERCAFDFYNAPTKTNLDATYDGANCHIKSVKGLSDFNGWGGLITVSGTDVYSQKKYCKAGGYDGANCFIYAAPAGTKAFIYNGSFYYTPKAGPTKCDSNATFDSANCWVGPIPAGATPFLWSNNGYVAPTAGCLHGTEDGNRCYLGTAPDGTKPFVYGHNLYYGE